MEEGIKMSTVILVYGTLKAGFGNHQWSLAKKGASTFLGNATLRGARMFSLGAYPGIHFDNEEYSIHGEVYEVHDENVLNQMHLMERGAGYSVETVMVEMEDSTLKEVLVYVQPYREGLRYVKDGVWKNTERWLYA